MAKLGSFKLSDSTWLALRERKMQFGVPYTKSIELAIKRLWRK